MRWILVASAAVAVGCGGPTKAAQPSAPQAAPPPAPAKRSVASSCSEERKTSEPKEADVDGDGNADIWKYYQEIDDPERPGERKTILVRQDLDLNWDGRIDVCRFFGTDGFVDKEEFDLDYDGKVDQVSTYEGGVVQLVQRDRNNDGRFDMTHHYKEGKLVQKEVDTNDDGKTDRWEYYDGPALDRVGIDLDHDGKVDRWAKSSK